MPQENINNLIDRSLLETKKMNIDVYEVLRQESSAPLVKHFIKGTESTFYNILNLENNSQSHQKKNMTHNLIFI